MAGHELRAGCPAAWTFSRTRASSRPSSRRSARPDPQREASGPTTYWNSDVSLVESKYMMR